MSTTWSKRLQGNAKDACYARSIFATYLYAYLLEEHGRLNGVGSVATRRFLDVFHRKWRSISPFLDL